ncbi:MAG: ribosome-associated translation inhibitor RaiA [Alphaproteobacteria bacterium]|nr:ribosome-associated translation inhibitor RaiA [Alphaproteobacteria bacterium]
MQIQITGKKIETSEALRTLAENKIQEIAKKYALTPVECSVTFSKDKHIINCDIEMHLARDIYVRAHEETLDAYLSLDQAIETFEKRLRRHKKRLIDHYKKRDIKHERVSGSRYVINAHEEQEVEADNPLVIAEMKTNIPTLTLSDAVMHLDLSDAQAILFNNEVRNQLNVVYRRPDGNIGWIAPSLNSPS